MYRFIATISPAFLRKLDQNLLINHPFLWATRIHHVLYWALLGNIFATCYAFLLPINEQSIPSPWSGTIVLSLPILIALVLWAKSLQERAYWQHQKTVPDAVLGRNLLLFGLGSLLISVIPIVYFGIVSMRLNALIDYGNYEFISLREQWVWLIFPFFWMLVEVFAYLRWHQILWAFVIGISLFILESMFFGLAVAGSGGNSAPAVLFLLFLVQLFAFTVSAYSSGVKSRFGRTWQTVCLVFSSLILLTIPTLFFGVSRMEANASFEKRELLFCWLVGLVLGASIWHFGFRKRILAIQAQPNS
ncbi:MAG: hypothetical protein AAF927_31865 [Bacteroidota bacterium]